MGALPDIRVGIQTDMGSKLHSIQDSSSFTLAIYHNRLSYTHTPTTFLHAADHLPGYDVSSEDQGQLTEHIWYLSTTHIAW